MKIKIKYYILLVLIAVCCILGCYSFILMDKATKAQIKFVSDDVLSNEKNSSICYDIKNGYSGTCYSQNELNSLSLDNKNSCLDYCTTHGPGRENGGTDLLKVGCRNYMSLNYSYGSINIPYWINMKSFNQISNYVHREKMINDIRRQIEMWNNTFMHDAGRIVNIFEVDGEEKPQPINGRKVIEILQADLTLKKAAGLFDSNNMSITLDYDTINNCIGYNVDTIAHEFGHALGLADIDSANGVADGTHKTLMGYNRYTSEAMLSSAIKYADIQGIAVTTGRHTCKDSNFMRYVKVGNEYRHICFYCDRIDNRTSIIPGSKEIQSNSACSHDYQPMVSCGERRWIKCTKCYYIIETVQQPSKECNVTLCSAGDVLKYNFIKAYYGEVMPEFDMLAPKKMGYSFAGYYDLRGKKYFGMRVVNDPQTANENGWDTAYVEKVFPVSGVKWDYKNNMTLYGRWTPLECDYTYQNVGNGKYLAQTTVILTHGNNTFNAINIDGYKFKHFTYEGREYSSPATIDMKLYRDYNGNIRPTGTLIGIYEEDECLAAGSMITLADGSQKAVENLTGDEMLLVWNLYTGSYDVAPILFIDSEPLSTYSVINLSFSDGTTVKVISEHGFWDCDLNKYVYLDKDAEKYIGHRFKKGDTQVTLTGVEIKQEYTSAWSPVTYGHLCYYVNGMLSMPGGIDGMFNIFEVDGQAMKYDDALMQADIEEYGLFTYEEFKNYVELPEEVFEAFNAQYLKVAIGKGLITADRLSALYQRYAELLG